MTESIDKDKPSRPGQNLNCENDEIRKIKKMHEFAQDISEIKNLDDILVKITNFIIRISNSDKAMVMLFDDNYGKLIIRAQKQTRDLDVELVSEEIVDEQIIQILSTKKSLKTKCEISNIEIIYSLYVPIIFNGNVTGVLSAQNTRNKKDFSFLDENYLNNTADYSAFVLERMKEACSLVNKKNVLVKLQQTGQKILTLSKKETEDKILKSFVKEASEVLGADIITLFKYDDKENKYKVPPYCFGQLAKPKIIQKPGEMHEKSIVLKIVKYGKSFYAPDAKNDWSDAGLSEFKSDTGSENFVEREGIISSAGIILRSDTSIIGVMFINYKKYKEFTDEDKEIIELFGNQAAIVIQQARNFDQQRKELKTITRISNNLLTTQDRRQILKDIVSGAIELTGATTGVIYLLSDDGKTVIDRFFPKDFDHPDPRLDNKNSITREVFKTGDVVNIPDLKKDDRAHSYLRKNFCSMIAVPLLINNVVIGVLFLDDKRRHDFNETEISLLLTLVSQAAVVIEQMQIQKELIILRDISLLIICYKSLSIVLDKIVKMLSDLLQANSSAILIHYVQEQKLKVVANNNLDIISDLDFDSNSGAIGKAINSRKIQFFPNYQEWEEKLPIFGQKLYRDYFITVVVVPIIWKDVVIGILLVSDNKVNRTISRRNFEVLSSISNLIAFAIGNSREQNYLKELVDISQDAIIAVNQKGQITQFNRASESILSYKKDNIIGADISKLYWDGINEAKRVNTELIENGNLGIINSRTFLKCADGKKIPISLSGKLLLDERNEHIGSFGILTDLREKEELLERKLKSDFLANLEKFPENINIENFEILSETLTKMLKAICIFCKLEYCIIFCCKQENENVLQAIAQINLPELVKNELPHFNWRKAGFIPENGSNGENFTYETDIINKWIQGDIAKKFLVNGVKGDQKGYFYNAAHMEPFRLADNYRSVIIFGPTESNNILDYDLLKNITLTVCTYALSWLQTLFLRSKQDEAKLTSKLITHRTLMNLTEVNGKFGKIKHVTDEKSEIYSIAVDGENIVQFLSNSIRRTLKSWIIDIEPTDYKFRLVSLATFVQNCVDRWVEEASKRRITFVVDPSIERLPNAEIDLSMFNIAFGNLIDNAVKYCQKNTFIHIYSEYNTKEVCIYITDIGRNMPEIARSNLKKPGKRWIDSTDVMKIYGTGLGFWEANKIAKTHGGEVDFKSEKYPQKSPKSYKVTVWIKIKLINT